MVRVCKLRYYGDVIHSFDWKSAVGHDGGVLKCVIVYLASDIPAFVMYYIYGESRSSLLVRQLYDTDVFYCNIYDK